MTKRKKHGVNEKKYVVTLKGYEKAQFESLNIGFTEFVRLCIQEKTLENEKNDIMKTKAEIKYLENKVDEKRLELEAYELLIENKTETLHTLEYNVAKENIVKKMIPLYNLFLENHDIADIEEKFYSSSEFRPRIVAIVASEFPSLERDKRLLFAKQTFEKYRYSHLASTNGYVYSGVVLD